MSIPKKPRRQHDVLLKAAFEEWFADFLRFMYPEADRLFDFSREFIFMDKELREIIPKRERQKGKRVADLLVKVYLKDGTEKWILLHTEIEGGNEKDLAFRLFQYHYRILDRYRVPVETIVVFTGSKSQRRPGEYYARTIGTSIYFRYLSYHIFDHTESELLAMDNPFALVILACQKAHSEGKVPDEELGEGRLTIAKALLQHNYPHDKILSFLGFLKNILYIDNQEINRKFDTITEHLTEKETSMGAIIEALKQIAREEGKLEGKQEGRLEGKQEGKLEGKYEQSVTIARELKKEGLSVEFIAKTTGLPREVIEKL